MSLTQNALNQRRGQLGQVVPGGGHIFRVGQVVADALDPLPPLAPGGLADIGVHQELLVIVPPGTGQARQPGGVAVLLVNLHPVLFTDGIQVVNTGTVLLIRGGINADNGVEALAA